MFKDTDKALARLEAELLREEEEAFSEEEEYEEYEEEAEEEPLPPPEYIYEDTRPSARPVFYQNYANGYHAYNADISNEDLDEYSQELLYEEESGKSNTALILIACLLSLTVTAAVLIWTMVSRGVI